MLAGDIARLADACQAYDVPVPATVTNAETFIRTVENLRAEPSTGWDKAVNALAATFRAPLDKLAAKHLDGNLDEINALMAPFGPQLADLRAQRTTALGRLAVVADNRLSFAWQCNAHILMDQFRAPFNDLAERYTASRAKGSLDLQAVNGLGQLAAVRDVLATAHRPTDLHSFEYERMTRCLNVPDVETVLRVIPVRVSADGPLGRPAERWSADWLAIVCAIPGVALSWNTPADQLALLNSRRMTAGNVR